MKMATLNYLYKYYKYLEIFVHHTDIPVFSNTVLIGFFGLFLSFSCSFKVTKTIIYRMTRLLFKRVGLRCNFCVASKDIHNAVGLYDINCHKYSTLLRQYIILYFLWYLNRNSIDVAIYIYISLVKSLYARRLTRQLII